MLIYFLRSPSGSIKIGATIRLSRRIKELTGEFGGGLEVLGVANGFYKEEKELHKRFAHLRQAGEWFDPGDDLIEYIASESESWTPETKTLERPIRHARIKLPEKDYERVQKAAGRYHMGVSSYIRLAVFKRIEEDEIRS